MIEQVTLRNFRSFSHPAEARFAPITLVYGPNSAGKSSIIKSLQFLRQSSAELGCRFFRFDGPFVDLGSARTTVHRHNTQESIGLDVDLGAMEFRGQEIGVRLSFRVATSDDSVDRFAVDIRCGDESSSVEFCRIAAQADQVRFRDRAAASAFDRAISILRGAEVQQFPELEVASGDPKLLTVFRLDRLVPSVATGRIDVDRAHRVVALASGPTSAEQVWAEFANRVAHEFGRSLEGLSYLGPLRRPWSRAEAVNAGSASLGVGPTGENSLNVLANRPDILAKVNQSLLGMESGYELCVNPWRGDDGVLEDLAPSLVVPSLRHLASGVSISPSDAGFGLSQLLPIVVEIHHRQRSLICIEQPELHLHPRLQARFGQVLRDAVAGRNQNRFLIETHSEHLLLRLQRLIREDMLDADDVCVLYVDNQTYDESSESYHPSISSEILELRLGATGSLLDPWPGGFFGERWEEM